MEWGEAPSFFLNSGLWLLNSFVGQLRKELNRQGF